MFNFLKKDTQVIIKFGPVVDYQDGVTPEEGLETDMDTVDTGIRISKNGGDFANRYAPIVSTTYDEYGYYNVTLKAEDVDTLGNLRVAFTKLNVCLPTWRDFEVMPSGFMTTEDRLQSHLSTIESHTQGIATIDTIIDDIHGVDLPAILYAAEHVIAQVDVGTVWDVPIADHLGQGTVASRLQAAAAGAGTGNIHWPYLVKSSVDQSPIPDCYVWVTSDEAGNNLLGAGRSNQYGYVYFDLDAGTVYVWRRKFGYTFTNPDREVVS